MPSTKATRIKALPCRQRIDKVLLSRWLYAITVSEEWKYKQPVIVTVNKTKKNHSLKKTLKERIICYYPYHLSGEKVCWSFGLQQKMSLSEEAPREGI